MQPRMVTNRPFFHLKSYKNGNQSAVEFYTDRFKIFHDNPDLCVIIGSTSSFPDGEPNEGIMDASAMTCLKNKEGVISGIVQTTTDGLGDNRYDAKENDSTAKIAAFSCQRFNQLTEEAYSRNNSTAHELKKRLFTVSHESINEALPCSRNQRYQSHCTLAATVLTVANNGQWYASFANIGDTLILILGASGQIKRILPGRVYYRGNNIWSPASLQDLTKKNMCTSWHDPCISESDMLDEGDVILQMTDGIWTELPIIDQEKNEGNVKYIESSVHSTFFNTQKIKSNIGYNASSYSTYLITETIVAECIQNLMKKRKLLNEIIENLATYSQNNIAHDITMLTWLQSLNNQSLFVLINTYIKQLQHDEDILSLNMPAYFFLEKLKQQSFGDCSTISALRVPHYLDELIKALIQYPERCEALLKQIHQRISQIHLIEASFSRLRAQSYIPRTNEEGISYKEIRFQPIFSNEILFFWEEVIMHYLTLTEYLQKKRPYEEKIVFVGDYLINLIDFKLILYLFDAFKSHVALNQHTFLSWNYSTKFFYAPCWKEQALNIANYTLNLLESTRFSNPQDRGKMLVWSMNQALFLINPEYGKRIAALILASESEVLLQAKQV